MPTIEELNANGGHTADCEGSCSPACPIGRDRRAAAEARAAGAERTWAAANLCGNCRPRGRAAYAGVHEPSCPARARGPGGLGRPMNPTDPEPPGGPVDRRGLPVTYPLLAARGTRGPRGRYHPALCSNDTPPDEGVQLERVTAERVEEGWLVSWPDGTATAYRTQRAALGAVLEYGKRNYPRAPRNREGDIRIGLLEGDIRIVEIEWKG